jgi:hypothetical protein
MDEYGIVITEITAHDNELRDLQLNHMQRITVGTAVIPCVVREQPRLRRGRGPCNK